MPFYLQLVALVMLFDLRTGNIFLPLGKKIRLVHFLMSRKKSVCYLLDNLWTREGLVSTVRFYQQELRVPWSRSDEGTRKDFEVSALEILFSKGEKSFFGASCREILLGQKTKTGRFIDETIRRITPRLMSFFIQGVQIDEIVGTYVCT